MLVTIKDIYRSLGDYADKRVKLGGWVKTARAGKSVVFAELSDGSFFKSVQVVFEEGARGFKEAAKLGAGAAITVTGVIVETLGGKQPFELKADDIFVESGALPDYPLQKKRHSLEYLRSIAHLRPRTNTFSAVFRVRSVAAFAIHKFFNERGFIYAHTPIITTSDAEGAGAMFQVTKLNIKNPPLTKSGDIDYNEDFFGKMANLTVSGQLSAESFALAFRSVYTFGPTFRAENSNTPRHAAEFWMVEPEISFADLADDMRLAEDMLKYVINYVFENAPEEMEFFNEFIDKGLTERLRGVADADFAEASYTEAIKILENSGENFVYPVKWGEDIQTEHERYLTERYFKKPVFITDYPKGIKAFYMRSNEDGETVAAMDLLAPGVGEIIGGSQREERLDALLARMDEMSVKPEDYWWYIELRKYGGVRHAGFGLGFERLIMYITGMSNIRDVIPFPRTARTADF
ncbi:MAG: asparagine--tRNA ligase [Clostridiales bacterium]|jgi:asparaginyl-tRNA synthetase|nr:asparagine--tRNA ligase [Clostridiales bacterium]